MRLTATDNDFAIVDEVLSPENFQEFWKYFNSLDYADRSITGWQKVWRINDGKILAGAANYLSASPFNSPLDWLLQNILFCARNHFKNIVGVEGVDWQDILLTPYLYGEGTKISWHNDYGYSGACIFYPHLQWSPFWGGELMIAKTPNPEDINSSDSGKVDMMTRSYVNPLLNAYGMGFYSSPLPNRMVFTKGSTWHQINRVDKAAGDNIRCSVVAFFLKDKIK